MYTLIGICHKDSLLLITKFQIFLQDSESTAIEDAAQNKRIEKQKFSNRKAVKKYRAKMNATADFKKNESKRVEACRKNRVASMSAEQKIEYKRRATERKRKSRALKNQNSATSSTATPSNSSTSVNSSTTTPTSTPNNPYKRPQSFGKAVSKSLRSLPSSPNKRRCVVAGLAKRIGYNFDESESEINTAAGPPVWERGRPPVSDNVVASVTEFFYRPDVSYTMPGMKDEMTVWEDGKKIKLQKYYLVLFLREAHHMYLESSARSEHVKFSKFCEMRPKNVLLMKQTPADQCKCKIHENLFLKLRSLKLPYTTFWEDVLCDNTINSLCWQGQCQTCANGKLIKPTMDPGATIQYRQWETIIKESVRRADQDPGNNAEPNKVYKKLECRLNEACAGEVLQQLVDEWDIIIAHINTKRVQAQEFESDKKRENVRVLQIDFAMNYSCEYQVEVQSALWSRASVTLFTAAAITKDSCQCFLVCSDTKDKDKDTVAAFLFSLYENHLFPTISDEIEEEIIWSDGPTSEFKNKFVMKLLHQLSTQFQKKFSWKFSATSHGKGVVDGIGGRAKSLVRQKVMSRSSDPTIVQSPKNFADTARKLMPKTTVLYIPESEIRREQERRQLWKDNLPAIPGITKFHVATHSPKDSTLRLRKHALGGESTDVNYTGDAREEASEQEDQM